MRILIQNNEFRDNLNYEGNDTDYEIKDYLNYEDFNSGLWPYQ